MHSIKGLILFKYWKSSILNNINLLIKVRNFSISMSAITFSFIPSKNSSDFDKRYTFISISLIPLWLKFRKELGFL